MHTDHYDRGGGAEIMAGRGSFTESFPLYGFDLGTRRAVCGAARGPDGEAGAPRVVDRRAGTSPAAESPAHRGATLRRAMADTGKIAKNLERFAQAVAAHDRENPTHTAHGIGARPLRHGAAGLRGGRGDPARDHDPRRQRRQRQLPRAVRRAARRGSRGVRGGSRRGGRHQGVPAVAPVGPGEPRFRPFGE